MVTNHMDLPTLSATVRRCALNALLGTSATSGVDVWIVRGALITFSFVTTFGARYLINLYTMCIFWGGGNQNE